MKIKCPSCKTENLFSDNVPGASRTCGKCKAVLEGPVTIGENPSLNLTEEGKQQKMKRQMQVIVFAIVWAVISFVVFLVGDAMISNIAPPIGDYYGTAVYNGQVIVNGRGNNLVEQLHFSRTTKLAICLLGLWLIALIIFSRRKPAETKNSHPCILKMPCPNCGATNMFQDVKDKRQEAFTCGKCHKLFGGVSESSESEELSQKRFQQTLVLQLDDAAKVPVGKINFLDQKFKKQLGFILVITGIVMFLAGVISFSRGYVFSHQREGLELSEVSCFGFGAAFQRSLEIEGEGRENALHPEQRYGSYYRNLQDSGDAYVQARMSGKEPWRYIPYDKAAYTLAIFICGIILLNWAGWGIPASTLSSALSSSEANQILSTWLLMTAAVTRFLAVIPIWPEWFFVLLGLILYGVAIYATIKSWRERSFLRHMTPLALIAILPVQFFTLHSTYKLIWVPINVGIGISLLMLCNKREEKIGFKLCPKCNKKNNPAFNKCWKCDQSIQAETVMPEQENEAVGTVAAQIALPTNCITGLFCATVGIAGIVAAFQNNAGGMAQVFYGGIIFVWAALLLLGIFVMVSGKESIGRKISLAEATLDTLRHLISVGFLNSGNKKRLALILVITSLALFLAEALSFEGVYAFTASRVSLYVTVLTMFIYGLILLARAGWFLQAWKSVWNTASTRQSKNLSGKVLPKAGHRKALLLWALVLVSAAAFFIHRDAIQQTAVFYLATIKMKSSDPRVRREGIRLLKGNNIEKAIPDLIKALEDPDETFAAYSSQSLGEVSRDPLIIPKMKRLYLKILREGDLNWAGAILNDMANIEIASKQNLSDAQSVIPLVIQALAFSPNPNAFATLAFKSIELIEKYNKPELTSILNEVVRLVDNGTLGLYPPDVIKQNCKFVLEKYGAVDASTTADNKYLKMLKNAISGDLALRATVVGATVNVPSSKDESEKAGLFEGKNIRHYPSGRVLAESSISKDGNYLDGPSKVFYENGQVKMEMFYANGKREGKVKEYYLTGQLKSEKVYEEGKPVSLGSEFYKNGKAKDGETIRKERAILDKGISYAQEGKHDEAIAELSRIAEDDSENNLAYYNRGNVYSEKEDYEKAISDYNKAIEIDPLDFQAIFNRGNAYGKTGNFDQAIFDMTRAIEINPKDGSAYLNRGIAYMVKKDYDNSWADIHRAIQAGGAVSPKVIEALKEASGRQD